jgi:hypothetical protein
LAYADDTDIIGRSESDTKKAYRALKIAADTMGLRVNEDKTKYMVIKNDKMSLEAAPYLYIDGQKFERVRRFIYLGSVVNDNNDISEEIRRHIQNSKCYYGLQKHFKSQLLTHETKVRLHRTLIRPILTYGCETWTLTKADELTLRTFER